MNSELHKRDDNDLAWNGVTPAEKEELYRRAVALNRGTLESCMKAASMCVDILNTAKAALGIEELRADHETWESLRERALELGQELVEVVRTTFSHSQTAPWQPSYFEITGVILMALGENRLAWESFQAGIMVAERIGTVQDVALLRTQCVYSALESGNRKNIQFCMTELLKALQATMLEPNTLTRGYRALAISAKQLAIDFAKEAKSENQLLKARMI